MIKKLRIPSEIVIYWFVILVFISTPACAAIQPAVESGVAAAPVILDGQMLAIQHGTTLWGLENALIPIRNFELLTVNYTHFLARWPCNGYTCLVLVNAREATKAYWDQLSGGITTNKTAADIVNFAVREIKFEQANLKDARLIALAKPLFDAILRAASTSEILITGIMLDVDVWMGILQKTTPADD